MKKKLTTIKYENMVMDGDEHVRYVLEKEDPNELVVLGLNPSTATDKKTDNTMTKVIGFAERNKILKMNFLMVPS